MKIPQSELIDAFLWHCKSGTIGRVRDPGWAAHIYGNPEEVLEKIRQALDAILDGEDVDKALGIFRHPGKPPDALLIQLDEQMCLWWREVEHQAMLEKEKWFHVRTMAAAWLAEHGREPLEEPALRKRLKPWLDFKAELDKARQENKT